MKKVYETRVQGPRGYHEVKVFRLRRPFWCMTKMGLPLPYWKVHWVRHIDEVRMTPIPIFGFMAARTLVFPLEMEQEAYKELGYVS